MAQVFSLFSRLNFSGDLWVLLTVLSSGVVLDLSSNFLWEVSAENCGVKAEREVLDTSHTDHERVLPILQPESKRLWYAVVYYALCDLGKIFLSGPYQHGSVTLLNSDLAYRTIPYLCLSDGLCGKRYLPLHPDLKLQALFTLMPRARRGACSSPQGTVRSLLTHGSMFNCEELADCAHPYAQCLFLLSQIIVPGYSPVKEPQAPELSSGLPITLISNGHDIIRHYGHPQLSFLMEIPIASVGLLSRSNTSCLITVPLHPAPIVLCCAHRRNRAPHLTRTIPTVLRAD
nr:hypothetical protein Iba_chr11dCG5410 [Ipomoea batatas]